jgi:ElaB/YqjD/DUF883 family membrane-anchored ribosome-binding protein
VEENKQNGSSGSNNFVLGQIIDISKNLSSITQESKVQFENLTNILKKIENVVNSNAQVTQMHSDQIKKMYSVLNQTIAAIKNLKTAFNLKTKQIESQLKNFSPKPKWRAIYSVIVGILVILGAVLINLERIKTLFGIGVTTP